MQLKTVVWVTAYRRTCAAAGAFATIAQHGDDDFGQVLIKVHDGAGKCRLFEPVSAYELDDRDQLLWREVSPGVDRGAAEASEPPGSDIWSEAACDAVLDRRSATDRDVWVVEVLDPGLADHLGDWKQSAVANIAWPPALNG
ncbi:MAG: DUF1491 family protein [Pseudomonadota bacterium]